MWIEVHDTLPDHPKVLLVADALKVPDAQVIGCLVCVWAWALTKRDDGLLGRQDTRAVERAARWPGKPGRLFAALLEAGWIDETEDGYCLHNWEQYAGKLLASKAASAQRAEKSRARRAESAGTVREPCANRAGTVRANRNLDRNLTLTIPKSTKETGETDGAAAPPAPKEPKAEKQKYGEEFGHVLLTPEEFKKMERYGSGMRDTYIERADRYFEQNGPKTAAKYKSHYAMICNWIAKDNDGVKKPDARAANGRPLSDSKEGGEDDGYPF